MAVERALRCSGRLSVTRTAGRASSVSRCCRTTAMATLIPRAGDLRRPLFRVRRAERGWASDAVHANGGGLGLRVRGAGPLPELAGHGPRRGGGADAGRGRRLGGLACPAPGADGAAGGPLPAA